MSNIEATLKSLSGERLRAIEAGQSQPDRRDPDYREMMKVRQYGLMLRYWKMRALYKRKLAVK